MGCACKRIPYCTVVPPTQALLNEAQSQTAATQPVATTVPVQEIAPAAASSTQTGADPLEIAALELLLADPATQEMIAHFGGPRELPVSGNPVADSLLQRYGADLVIRLNQLQTAQQAVVQQYLEAFKENSLSPSQNTSNHLFNTGPWNFELQEFTRRWAAGDSPAQKNRSI